MASSSTDLRLTRAEITKLVYKWIGVSGGYLGNFSYTLHDRFWLDVCDVSVSTAAFAGTTRECFEATLFDASAAGQAAALRAILDEYPPVDDRDAQGNFRASRLHAEILRWIERLETGHVAVPMHLASTTDIVRRALDDADVLLKSSGPQSAVDRVHTAFHGYLYALSNEAGVGGLPDRPTMNQLFKAIRGSHPALTNLGPGAEEISRVLQSMATILDALNPVRNNASVAHANESLVGEPEAVLVINTIRTLLGYLEAKRRSLVAPLG